MIDDRPLVDEFDEPDYDNDDTEMIWDDPAMYQGGHAVDIEALLARLRELAEIDYREMPLGWPEIYPLMAQFAEMQQLFRDLDEYLSAGRYLPKDWAVGIPA